MKADTFFTRRCAGFEIWLMLPFFVALLLPSQSIAQRKHKSKTLDTAAAAEMRLKEVLDLVNDRYVETPDMEKASEQAIVAMLKTLDPHSVYISANDVQKANENLQGNFEGVGITFQILDDTVNVVEVIDGGPSYKAGIQAGDKIVRIDGKSAVGDSVNNTFVSTHLRGTKGSVVEITMLRGKSELNFKVTRDKVPIYSVETWFMENDSVGYIKLSRFARTSADEVCKALDQLKKLGMKALMLDLRGNSGGFLDVATSLANEFLPARKLIVYQEGRRQPRHSYSTNSHGRFREGRLVVLIDENSASASEIVSGAIQDWDRGTVVGRRTFGKGLVQRELKYVDGSALRITTARYYTPSGRTIQSPYEDGNTEQYYADHRARYAHGESFSRDSIRLDESQKFKTLVKGRTVYGGGGIMPDVFVPRDTSYISPFYSVLAARSTVQEFVNGYVDVRRAGLLEQYPSWEELSADPDMDALYAELVQYAKERNIPAEDADVLKSSSEIILAMKALIARALWDENAYYRIINSGDEDYRVALEEVAALRAL